MNGPHAVRGTAILVWSAGLDAPERVATLFMTAQACAAMEMETELYFSAQSVVLLQSDRQATPVGYGPHPKPLGEYLQETAQAGVRLLACSQALQALGLDGSRLSPHCAGPGGVVQFAARCADPAWRTLVF